MEKKQIIDKLLSYNTKNILRYNLYGVDKAIMPGELKTKIGDMSDDDLYNLWAVCGWDIIWENM